MSDESEHPMTPPSWPTMPELELDYDISECKNDLHKLKRVRGQFEAWLEGQAESLSDYMANFDTFDLLSSIMLSQLTIDPENYSESTHEGLSAVVEFAALLMARQPPTSGRGYLVGGEATGQIIERIRSVLHLKTFYDALDSVPTKPGAEATPLDFLSFHSKGYEGFVRSPGYEHHLRDRLQKLFGPFAAELVACVGFDLNDIFHIEDYHEKLVQSRLSERRKLAQKHKATLLDAVELVRAGNAETVDEEYRSTAMMLADSPKDQLVEQVEILVGLWILSFLGHSVYTFTSESLATASGCQLSRVDAVLSFFGLEFGSVDSLTSILSPTHILRTRPFLYFKENFIYSTPTCMLWATRSRLEEVLNPSTLAGQRSTSQTWDTYEKQRSAYLEVETVRLFANALKCKEIYRNLRYRVNPDDLQPVELDALIKFDRTLVLIEAKSGSLTPTARRGSKRRLEDNLKSLFGESHSQALRAKQFIMHNDKPVFLDVNGSTVEIDKSLFNRIVMVTVTLEPLDHFSTQIYEMVKSGIYTGTDIPWALSLDTLIVVAEMIEFPSQLIHFILRRLEVSKSAKFRFADELDIFGYYLKHGLYFDGEDEFSGADIVQFVSCTDDFDSYYFFEMGYRETPVSKPRQFMPPLFRELVIDIDSRNDLSGHSEIVLSLLNWNTASREQIGDHLSKIRSLTKQDRNMHDFMMFSEEGKCGITVVSTPSRLFSRAFATLRMLVQRRFNIHSADFWVGLLSCTDQQGLIQAFGFENSASLTLASKPGS